MVLQACKHRVVAPTTVHDLAATNVDRYVRSIRPHQDSAWSKCASIERVASDEAGEATNAKVGSVTVVVALDEADCSKCVLS